VGQLKPNFPHAALTKRFDVIKKYHVYDEWAPRGRYARPIYDRPAWLYFLFL